MPLVENIKAEAELRQLSQDTKGYLRHALNGSLQRIRSGAETARDHTNETGTAYLEEVDKEIQYLVLEIERLTL